MDLLLRGRRFAPPLPDALMALLYALAIFVDQMPGRMELVFALVVEGGFLMMQGTLVDIATRLKKRPPVWTIPIIVGLVALFSGHPMEILKMAWSRGAFVLIPLLISLLERGTVLWRMPNRTRIQKIAARALIANRITTALALGVLVTIAMVAGLAFDSGWPIFTAGALYFAIAAYDDWRVRGPKFAETPRVLFGFDPMHIHHLDPL